MNTLNNTVGDLSSFADYRNALDGYGGLMRFGICDQESYNRVGSHESTTRGVVAGLTIPTIAAADVYSLADTEEPTPDSVLVPLDLVSANQASSKLVMEQFDVPATAAHEVINPIDKPTLIAAKLAKIIAANVVGQPVNGHGEPQFLVSTEYDLSNDKTMRSHPPQDVLTRDGHTLTTDQDRVLDNLEGLASLQDRVFKRQAGQIGYYDGLSVETIEAMLSDDGFIGAAAFDHETGDPFMFALFAAGESSVAQVPWINERNVKDLLASSDEAKTHALSMPVIIASKARGLGVFNETVKQAMHETLYRTQADMYSAVYSTNAQSIMFTPRILDGVIRSQGAKLVSAAIEATVVTHQP